ncbi:hypothetical protein L1987_72159 [Smallanthus sonchifolius]|uniref:Uncharacterized protein n=1 Tax=Smallanthus sonchifolius TaxID=185202 RepID=A0ACB9AUU3_9ASTR|nr:hypothetical protein L1987_72159 [Smallanthus sonchifolius]
MAEDGKVQIEKFDGTDFAWWKMQIVALLSQRDLDVVLEEKTDNISQDVWDSKDKKAKAAITLSLTRSVAFNIMKETTARGMITALSNMYEKPSGANKMFLLREFFLTMMKEGDVVTEHINNLNSLLSRLSSVGINFDDETQGLALLSSLPNSWSGTVTAITNSTGPSGFTFEGMRDLILGEDGRRRKQGSSSSSELLSVSRGRGNNRESGSRGRSASRTPKTVTCWGCKEVGHFKSQCPKAKKEKSAEVNTTEVVCYDDVLVCSVESSVGSWVMDSGASIHAMHSSESMVNLKEGDFGQELHLMMNLISVSQLDEQGLDVKFGGGKWKVLDGNLVIARGEKRGSLYLVEVPAEGCVTVPVQSNKIRFTESRTKRVHFANVKPRATEMSVECVRRVKPVKGLGNSGSTGRVPGTVPRVRWVLKTKIPNEKVSPEDCLLNLESDDGLRCISGAGGTCKSVETEDGSVMEIITAGSGMTGIGLKLGGASTGLSEITGVTGAEFAWMFCMGKAFKWEIVGL